MINKDYIINIIDNINKKLKKLIIKLDENKIKIENSTNKNETKILTIKQKYYIDKYEYIIILLKLYNHILNNIDKIKNDTTITDNDNNIKTIQKINKPSTLYKYMYILNNIIKKIDSNNDNIDPENNNDNIDQENNNDNIDPENNNDNIDPENNNDTIDFEDKNKLSKDINKLSKDKNKSSKNKLSKENKEIIKRIKIKRLIDKAEYIIFLIKMRMNKN